MSGVKLPTGAMSPRISGGTLKWYAGDTFTLYLRTELTDGDGEAVHVGEGEMLRVEFFDCCQREVYSYGVLSPENDTVALEFNEEVSALFPAGEYTYDVYLKGDRRVTLAKGNPVTVE